MEATGSAYLTCKPAKGHDYTTVCPD
jgi:hypothetical protein